MNARRGAPGLFLGLLLVAAFGGCVSVSQSKAAPDASTDATVAPPPQFNEDEGAIAGTVTNDEGFPVQHAMAAVAEGNLSSESDAEGHFTISHVPPGTHTLNVIALGYDSFNRKVEVEAGKVAQVSVLLTALPVEAPFHSTKQENGYVLCSLAMRPGIPTGGVSSGIPKWIGGVAVCGAFGLLGITVPGFPNDRFLINFNITKGVSEVLMEMSWSSTQAAGRGLTYPLEHANHPNVDKYTFGSAVGMSPLTVYANESKMKAVAESSGIDCFEKGCVLTTRVFASANTTNYDLPTDPPIPEPIGKPGTRVDVGFVLEQSFSQYMTQFHFGPRPALWSALADK